MATAIPLDGGRQPPGQQRGRALWPPSTPAKSGSFNPSLDKVLLRSSGPGSGVFGEADAGEGDAEVAAEEVAEGGSEDGGARRPRAALEDAVVAVEPLLRVFGIGEGLEAGEALERVGRP